MRLQSSLTDLLSEALIKVIRLYAQELDEWYS